MCHPSLRLPVGHLLVFSCLANICYSQSSTRITIVHTSDAHLHFAESGTSPGACHYGVKCHGGLSRFVKFIEKLKEARSNMLVVDSGGLIPGRLLQVKGGREAVIELVKPLPYDAMALGAFELDDGIDAVADYVKIIGQKFVCTNLEFSKTSESGRYLSKMCHKTMIKMYGELQIGILSYISKESMTKSIPGITVIDEIQALEAGISELEATSEDINVILVLGYSPDALDTTILEKVPKINLIISGHSYMMFYNGTPPSGAVKDYDYPHIIYHSDGGSRSRPVPNQMVAGAYFHLLYAGRLKLKITDRKVVLDADSASNPVYMNGDRDPDTDRLLAKHQATISEALGEPIGFNAFLMDGSRQCHRRECSMGNLLADAMVEAALDLVDPPLPPGTWTRNALALLDSGRITSSLERGTIYSVDLRDALRNDTGLELLRLTGAELRRLLENSTRRLDGSSGSFLQVSGLQVTALEPRPGQPLELNISTVCLHCLVVHFQPLDDDADYTVVVTSAFAAQVTAPGGGLTAARANRSRRFHDSLFRAAAYYISHISPVMVATGDRLMVPLPSAADRHLHGWPTAGAAELLLVLAVVMSLQLS